MEKKQMTLPNPEKPLKIGTRNSPLAMAQAFETRARLMQAHNLPEAAFVIVDMTTKGDQILDRTLSAVGGKGLFTKEIEDALLDGRIDIAVHSTKDMPTELPDGLVLGAYLPREDVRDALITPEGLKLEDLPQAAIVGTASLRRAALVIHLRPDLQVVPFRGNVQTRLRKLAEGEAHATLLAEAGLRRLGLHDLPRATLDPEMFTPAVGQGAVCIEARESDEATLDLLHAIHDLPTEMSVEAERAMLAMLDGSCHTPIAAYVLQKGDLLTLTGVVLSVDGRQKISVTLSEPLGDDAIDAAICLGVAVAENLLSQGAAALIAPIEGKSW